MRAPNGARSKTWNASQVEMTVLERRVCRLRVNSAIERPLSATSLYGRCCASGHSRRAGHYGVWPKRCIHPERRGLMQTSESRYVLLLPLQSHPRDVKTESTPKCRAFRLASPISSSRPLKWRTGSAILKSLVCEHRAHTAFHVDWSSSQHEVQYLGIGVALVTRP